MTIQKIEHVGIMVNDIEASISFYTKVLGLKHLRTMPHSNGIITLAFLAYPHSNETVIELIQGYNTALPAEGKVHHLAFTVSDIEAEFERIKQLPEVKLKDEELTVLPDGSRYFFFYGPDGEFLELFEPGTIVPYPLQFEPQFKERVWGGRALEQFGLTPPEGAIGEGWMISDHPNGITKIMNGPLAGTGLDVLREQFGAQWFGKNGLSGKSERFPLLIKLLDCNDDLSVQVHPTDDYEKLPKGELGKTEMWYILSAKPDAKIIYGLKDQVTKQQLAAALVGDGVMELMQEVSVKAGDAFYIPAGTVHALCSGVVVAEIQQNSDTTYRLYDYNRPGLDGKPRELHIEESLEVIAYEGAGAAYVDTSKMKAGEWLTIAQSPYFKVDKGVIEASAKLTTSADSFEIIVVAEGTGSIAWGTDQQQAQQIKAGECFLLPATLGDYTLSGDLTVLRSVVPSA